MLDFARNPKPSVTLIALSALLAAGAARASENSPAPAAVVVEGELEVLQSCDFEGKHRQERSFFVRDANGDRRYELRLPASRRAERLLTGMQVRAAGLESGGTLDATTGSLTVLSSTTTAVADTATSVDVRRAVVLLVNFVDGAVSCSPSQVAGTMFTNAQNVAGYYQETSFGSVAFANDVNADGAPDVYSVSIPNSVTEACNYTTWAANADTAATASGVNLTLYQHRVYVLPSTTTTCSWGGMANVGCSSGTCRAWTRGCSTADSYAHELGHNLALAHSSTDLNNDGATDNEYGDMSDVMGYSGVGWRHHDAPHKVQEGWIPSSKVADAGAGGTFTIAPVEADPASTGMAQALRIPKANSPGTSYYVSYRHPLGSYSTNLVASSLDKASIHRYTSGSANTYLLANLSDGQSWTDATNGITVSAVSHDSVSLTVQVSTTCAAAAPKVTFAPSSQSGRSGAAASYTVTVTNTDAASCGSSTFALSGSVPSGWSGTASAATLTLAPSAQASVTLAVTSAASSTPGTYGVSITAADASNAAHHASASGGYLVDNQPPNAVANLTGGYANRKVQLSWTVPSDNGGSGVVKYWIYRNNGASPYATTSSTSYVDGAISSGATYSYSVVAVDAAGNASAPGNTVNVTAKK